MLRISYKARTKSLGIECVPSVVQEPLLDSGGMVLCNLGRSSCEGDPCTKPRDDKKPGLNLISK
jgi:hypothetical protein